MRLHSPLRATTRRLSSSWICKQCLTNRRSVSYNSDFSKFYENDIVILKPLSNKNARPMLSKPLHSDGRIGTHRGDFKHSDIIGLEPRGLIKTEYGQAMRVHFPTLSEYVSMSKRLVTPIYSGEANLIVSLLDIHATSSSSPLEILEFGTGHGSLALHLARAIHASNGAARAIDDEQQSKASRNAILHTLDNNSRRSTRAKSVVKEFRRGQYAGDIEFYVDTVDSWIKERKDRGAFLSHVVADLPDVHETLQHLGGAVKVDGSVAVFAPSISQIVKCVQTVKERKLPFVLDQVVELGASQSAGRQWEVKLFTPRARSKVGGDGQVLAESEDGEAFQEQLDDAPVTAEEPAEQEEDDSSLASLDGNAYELRDQGRQSSEEDQMEVICRPKFGVMTVGGGFLGIWKRKRDNDGD